LSTEPSIGEDDAALATLLHGHDVVEVESTAAAGSRDGPAPSFSLVRLGAARDYNESKGLIGGHFVQGANRLVPLDVQTRRRRRPRTKKKGAGAQGGGGAAAATGTTAATTATTANEGDATPTPKNPWKTPTVVASPASVLGVANTGYMGYHYECPRGCRFINVAPNRHVQLSSAGLVKESGMASLKTPMPLFTQCDSPKCVKEWLGPAQLNRIYIVTPGTQHETMLAPQLSLISDDSASTLNSDKVVTIATIAGAADGVRLDPSTFYVLLLPRAVTETAPASMTLLPAPIRIS
jgi:hypothetical protein